MNSVIIWPWRQCKAKLPPKTPLAGPYFGRCDLIRGHAGDHRLERGFDTIMFRIEVVPVVIKDE